jgi:DNA polymerase-1
LGDEFAITVSNKDFIKKEQPVGVQTDLFGNIIETAAPPIPVEQASSNGNDSGESISVSRNINNTPHKYEAVQDNACHKKLVAELKKHDEICFDTETTGIDANDAELVGLSFSIEPGRSILYSLSPGPKKTKEILALFEPLFNDKSKTWIGQNTKYDMLVLKWYDIELKGKIFDTMLAHYVIEPDGKRSMDQLSAKYLGYEPVHIEELIGKKGRTPQGSMRDVELEKIKEYAAEDADITLQLKQIFLPQLKEKEVEKVFYEVENPLVKVLTDMEFEGVKIDEEFLMDYSRELEKDAKKAEESVLPTSRVVRFNSCFAQSN